MPNGNELLKDKGVRELICLALEEDIDSGDVTSSAVLPPEVEGSAVVESRGDYVVCGNTIGLAVFKSVDAAVEVELLIPDGEAVKPGDHMLRASGSLRSLLTAERTVLNFMQRMTGIATMTRQFTELVREHDVRILDTRKTTPGMRRIEKYAVTCGGGTNHRMGLYDQVMLKDNHLLGWAEQDRSLPEAVRVAREKNPELVIEVEADTVEQVRELVEAAPDWILLDNMSLDELRECVVLCKGRCKTEASGGVNLDTVAGIAATGVDAISVGALTHSVPSADLGLEVIPSQ